MLADSGCDTMMCGQGWKVDATTGRKVSVQGFKDDMQAVELEIGSLITAIDLPDQTIILEANEAIMMPQNQTSLLSTFQVRESGHKVNDVAHRHGGTQEITADGFNIPLFV